MNKKKEILRLRKKLLDAESEVCGLEDTNNLFMPFAAENSPEGLVIAELISTRLKKLRNIIIF